MNIHTLAQNDDDATAAYCVPSARDVASDDYNAWLRQYWVEALPQAVINGIRAYAAAGGDDGPESCLPAGDDGPAVTIVDGAVAPYGGGMIVMRWYEAADGSVYGVQTFCDVLIAIPAASVDEMPRVILVRDDSADEVTRAILVRDGAWEVES